MAIKWKNLSARELEIYFDTGTRILALDKKPVAAIVKLPNNVDHFLQSSKITNSIDKQLINLWFGSQPQTIRLVDPDTFDILISREHQR